MRLKIIAGNLLLVLATGLVGYFYVRAELQDNLGREVEQRLAKDAILLSRSYQLAANRLVDYVEDRSKSREVVAAIMGLDENTRRARAHQASNSVARWLRDPARGSRGAPDVVLITDETGGVIARNQDANRMHNVALAQRLPALRAALRDGSAKHDIWQETTENKVLQTAVAPIRSQAGAVIGALVVGYDLSNGFAESEAEVLGRDVTFIIEGQVYSSSLGSTAQELREFLFGPQSAQTAAALADPGTSSAWSTHLGGAEWIGITAPLPMSPSVPVAYAVAANKTERMALAGMADVLLLLTVLSIILVIVYGFIVGSSFLRPMEQIEDDVLAVINGRTDVRIDIESSEFGGLAYRINQLINVFTGVSEEDNDGRVSTSPGAPDAEWAAVDTGTTPSPPQPEAGAGDEVVDDPAVAQALASEPEAGYLARVHEEYVAAKTSIGEDVSNIPQDRFSKRLIGNGQALAAKHGCAQVRFRVVKVGDQVKLQPVLIR